MIHTGGYDTGRYDTADTAEYDTGGYEAADTTEQDTGGYDTADTGGYDTGGYEAADTTEYDTGGYDTADTVGYEACLHGHDLVVDDHPGWNPGHHQQEVAEDRHTSKHAERQPNIRGF